MISMVDSRTLYAREIIELVKENYGESLRIFDTMIPFSVRAAETSAAGVSIYSLYPEHKVTQAYEDLTGEVIASAHCDSKEARKLRRYAVEVTAEAAVKYYYIMNNDTLEVEILPTRYLTHKTRSNRSPNTVKRSAYSLCYYMEYMAGKEMELLKVYELTYEEQNLHFIQFLKWLRAGGHKEQNSIRNANNGTCNAYLEEVFRFYLFIENEHPELPSLKVLSYNYFVKPDEVGVKKRIGFHSFKGYLDEKGRKVRPAEHEEIIAILQACTNSRDQLLLLMIAETGFRIGEILGVDYSRDIDYENHMVGVYFRDDNENDARAKNAEYRKAKISDETFEEYILHCADS